VPKGISLVERALGDISLKH